MGALKTEHHDEIEAGMMDYPTTDPARNAWLETRDEEDREIQIEEQGNEKHSNSIC